MHAADVRGDECRVATVPFSVVRNQTDKRALLVLPAHSLTFNGGTLQATDIIASEIVSLNPAPGSNVNSLDPAFVDPANADHHLKPESPAADYHLATNPDFFDTFKDLDGRGRGVSLLSHVPANGSPKDIGAYELQSLGDLLFVDGVEGFR